MIVYGHTVLVCRREYLAPQRRAWLCRSRQGLRVEGAGDKDLGGRRRANTREVAGHYLRREGCTVVSARNPRHPPPARRTARERAQIEVSDTGKGMPPKTCHTPSSAHTRGEVSDARGHRRQLRGRFVTGDSPWSHLTIRWRGRRRKPPRPQYRVHFTLNRA